MATGLAYIIPQSVAALYLDDINPNSTSKHKSSSATKVSSDTCKDNSKKENARGNLKCLERLSMNLQIK